MKTKTENPAYEFGGPLGTLVIAIGLPLGCFLTAFACNAESGCPAPVLLHPSRLTLATLKREVGWPSNGFAGLFDTRVLGWTLAYYALTVFLWRVLPGDRREGSELRSGGKLSYKFNAFTSSVLVLGAAAVGTVVYGPDFVLWTFLWDHYITLITANTVIALALAWFVYVRSFSVRPPKSTSHNAHHAHPAQRELAPHGHSGNIMYDWFMGRELNPRVKVPLIGEIDIKTFCELRPGMLGWMLLNASFAARQYRNYGYVTDSMALITLSQALYTLDAMWMEPAILTTIDITTDGFGFMLSVGDLVWLPFMYSWQARYLAMYPVHLGPWGILGVLAVAGAGYTIFRQANNEKNRFRSNPTDSRVSHLKYIRTRSGSRLLTSGWWGTARHINYLGDWIMSWAYCLPTGLAGFVVQRSSSLREWHADDAFVGAAPPGFEIVQGEARGWGTIFTYFFMLYFAILLVHREIRDEEKCKNKYGKDWEEYKRRVRWRIVPGLY